MLAKHPKDGTWYAAKIESVGGSALDRVYSVQWRHAALAKDAVDIVRHDDTRKLPDRHPPQPSTAAVPKPTLQDPPKKKKTKPVHETVQRQKAWLAFASGKTMKNVRGSGVLPKKSMFASTEQDRLGVIKGSKPGQTLLGERRRLRVQPGLVSKEEDPA